MFPELPEELDTALGALIFLAENHAHRVRPVMLDHELDIFRASMRVIKSRTNIKPWILSVLQRSLYLASHDLAQRLLGELDPRTGYLRGQDWVLRYVILFHNDCPSDILQRLILDAVSHGAPVDVQDQHGYTPIFFACEYGLPRVFDLLVKLGATASPSAKYTFIENSKTRRAYFQQACAYVPSSKVDLGLSTMDFSDELQVHEDLLQVVCRQWQEHPTSGDPYTILFALLDFGFRPEPFSRESMLICPMLCGYGHLLTLKSLMRSASDDSVLCHGMSLQAASVKHQPSVVRFLLDLGAAADRPGLIHDFWPALGPEYLVRSSEHTETPVRRALVAARLNPSTAYEVCKLLLDAGVSEIDQKLTLEFVISQGWKDEASSLIARGIRLDFVPLCSSPEIIDLMVQNSSAINTDDYLQYAISSSNLSLLQHLEYAYGIAISEDDFGSVVRSLMLRSVLIEAGQTHTWSRYSPILEHLIHRFHFSLDTSFLVPSEDCSKSGDNCGFERTNLLCLASAEALSDVVQWLLEEGADASCPELAQSALAYAIGATAKRGLYEYERVIRLLLRHSSPDSTRDVQRILSATIGQLITAIETCRQSMAWCSVRRLSMGSSAPVTKSGSADSMSKLPIQLPSLWSREYHHSKLRAISMIRLFHLRPAESMQNPISATISCHELIHVPSYEALSYEWGSPQNPLPISVNGKRFLVRQNLAAALRRLRRRNAVRTLWIDAVCINQNNNEEKGQQVGLMSEIYRRADRVSIWLGEEFAHSSDVFQMLHSLDTSALEEQRLYGLDISAATSPYQGEVRTVYESLTRRSWFTRTWVLQEAALAREATIFCGADSVGMSELAIAGYMEGDILYHPVRGVHGPSYAQQIFRQDLSKGMTKNIGNIIWLSRYCHSTDPRDKVYGILGLLDQPLMPISYDTSVEDVYLSFTKAVIERPTAVLPTNLAILHWMGPQRRLSGLCSWVPDWSVTGPTGVLPRAFDARGQEMFNKHMKHHYSQPIFASSGRELVVKCIFFDRVKGLGPEMSVGTQEQSRVLLSWEKMVVERLRQSGLDGLESFSNTLHGLDQYRTSYASDASLLRFLMWYDCCGSGFLREVLPSLFTDLELLAAILDKADTSPKGSIRDQVKDYADHMEITCHSRRFLLSENGSMGLAPFQASIGDKIVLVPGGSYAYMLRSSQKNTHAWEMVGDCSLDDIDVAKIIDEGTFETVNIV